MWVSNEEMMKYFIWSRTFSFNIGITIFLILLFITLCVVIYHYIKECIKSIKTKIIVEYMKSIGYTVQPVLLAGITVYYFYKDGLKYYDVNQFCNNHYYSLKIVKERYKKDED